MQRGAESAFICSGFSWKSDDLGLGLVLAGASYCSFSLPFNRTRRETNDHIHLVSYGLSECTLLLLLLLLILRLICSQFSCALFFFPFLLVLFFFFLLLRFPSCVACIFSFLSFFAFSSFCFFSNSYDVYLYLFQLLVFLLLLFIPLVFPPLLELFLLLLLSLNHLLVLALCHRGSWVAEAPTSVSSS